MSVETHPDWVVDERADNSDGCNRFRTGRRGWRMSLWEYRREGHWKIFCTRVSGELIEVTGLEARLLLLSSAEEARAHVEKRLRGRKHE